MLEDLLEGRNPLWILAVMLFTILMLFLVRIIFHNLIKKSDKHSPHYVPALRSIRSILYIFFTALGVGLIFYTLLYTGTEQESKTLISQNIERIVWIGFVAVATRIAVALSRSYFRHKIEKSFESDQQDPTSFRFLNSLTTIFIYIIGISLAAYSIPQMRFLAQSALTGAGMVALVIGVASQEAIANIVSRAFIVAFKPFQIGQRVKIGSDISGIVEDLTLRHTVIRDYQNRRIVIPNSVINKESVTNFDLIETKVCDFFEVGISYESDVNLALSILKEEAENHPFVLDNRSKDEIDAGDPIVEVRLVAWENSSVTLRAYIWARDNGQSFQMRHQLLKSIKARFEANGIEIPYPHQVNVQKESKKEA